MSRKQPWISALAFLALLAVAWAVFGEKSSHLTFLDRFNPRSIDTGLVGVSLIVIPQESAQEIEPVLRRELLSRGWVEVDPILQPSPGQIRFVKESKDASEEVTYQPTSAGPSSGPSGVQIGKARYTIVPGEGVLVVSSHRLPYRPPPDAEVR